MARHSKFGDTDDRMVEEGDAAFLRMNTRLRPNQLQPGEVALSENGRMETDATWQPREGYDNLTGPLTQNGVALFALDSGSTGIIPLFADVSVTSSSRTTGTVTINATAHGRSVGETVNLTGILGFTNDPNGNRVITEVPDANSFKYVDGGATDEAFTASTGTVGEAKLDEDAVVEVFGSCVFSDVNDENAEWILIATTNGVIAYDLGAADVEASAVEIDYPASATLDADVDMRQAFAEVFIFREGDTAWVWDGDFAGGLAFAEVPSGSKTQHKIFQDANNTAIASGVATVTDLVDHDLAVGDTVIIVDPTVIDVTETEYRVASVPTAKTFTYYVDAADVTTTVVYSTQASLGGGYINMPAAPWGTYHQRRMWVPYFYDDQGTPADRDVRDEVIASDILDPYTYDPISNQFRITAGVADHLVAVHPFNEDNLLAFNRNSIHLLKGVSGSLGDVQTVEITREIGCAARKSAVTYSNAVLFLSDNGVYSLSFQDEYNLRGTELPLSEAITTLIQRINKAAFQNAVGVYHDNRYYLAIPLDDSTENNAILVYNFINQGWESIDTVGASSFDVLNFHVGRAEEYNELYCTTRSGGIYKLSDTSRDTDELINNLSANEITEFPVPSSVTLRQYTHGTLDRKKWNRLEMQFKSGATSATDGNISVALEDPDATVTLDSMSSLLGGELARDEDATLTSRIGNNRAHGAQVTFTPTLGRPALRAIRVQGMLNFRSGTTVE